MSDVTAEIGRREEKRRETGARIYATALDLFRRDGFENVKVEAVAKAAGVSVPTFYAHFPSREAMLMPLPPRDDIAAAFAAQRGHQSVGDRARAVILAWLGQLNTYVRDDVLTRWQIIAETPALRLRTAEFERGTAALVVDVLRAENGGDVVPAATVAVNALMSAYTEILLRWAEDGGARDLLEIAQEVLAELRDQL